MGLPLRDLELLAIEAVQPAIKTCGTVDVFGNENLQFVGQGERAAVKWLVVKQKALSFFGTVFLAELCMLP